MTTTRAIVLHKTNYSESSLVVHILTSDFGRRSMLVAGAKKRNSRRKPALFEPLSILDITGNFSSSHNLVRPVEVKIVFPFPGIQSKIKKRLVALFIAEVLFKCVKESGQERDMFLYIQSALLILEHSNSRVDNFHLVFLLSLTQFLGFYPVPKQGKYFNMSDGEFTNDIPISGFYLVGDEKNAFNTLLISSIHDCHHFIIPSTLRMQSLENILIYYRIHFPEMGVINSIDVLKTILI